MAKKAELFEELKKLNKKTELTQRNTIAEIEAEILKFSGLDKVQKEAAEATVETSDETTEKTEDASFAKAGKRSKKTVEEAQAEAERQDRKENASENPVEVKKGPKPVVRPLIERRGKKYQEVAKLIENEKIYSLGEALVLATKTNPAKFDATVEIHIRMGVDPRQADQNIRATVSLPNGNGKTVRVAVFAPEADAKAATAAGADIAGDDEFLKQLDKEKLDFDVLISTPAYMPKLGKYARLLGPKGLMPNPKAGTVTTDIKKAVTEAKAGKIEYRVDKQSIIHVGIGKVSFGDKKLVENATVFFESLKSQRPASIKGTYVKSVNVSTSQGPNIKVENLYN
jgi:ribosomal protein L1, bacterial/chloroplast